MTENTSASAADTEQPFVAHLIELRDRLLRMVGVILLIFLGLFPFANDIYTAVAAPLVAHLPEGATMIATGVASPFLTPFKLSLVASIFLAMPFILFQFWSFIAPGLYRHEKQLFAPLLASSIGLFYVGIAFAYFVVFPLVFAFLASTTPEGVAMMTDIAQYLDFVLTLFFAFGVAFEVPIATILLVLIGATTPDKLAEKRPFIIVAAFVIGMFLTPPDVISQTLLALPMWLLFEIGIIFARIIKRNRKPEDSDDDPDGDGSDKDEPFVALSDDEMDAELDRIEAEEDDDLEDENSGDNTEPSPVSFNDPIEQKLSDAYRLRQQNGKEEEARQLLYEVLADGDQHQQRVAQNILKQMDDNS